ncbi:topoisomerase C-terminal repeat-containing protein [Peribacillus frigoritolerans]|uniref:Topoisomerase C-terminal repeat-containing protein n=1 Tax=Peribacillus frigoritolerans TaxID=450367 RepID=A0AAJ1VBW0_9BACI|nr:topoisomerase C-terminal repeat-containing protein [Peribacillus frigoritolerans]MDM5284832.1 topoisomerase C-terminal repeat-containing protein [Peribacillus frigoritolerans]
MEAIEDNLLRISVIVIALIKFLEYSSGCKQIFPSQMLGKKGTEKHVKDLCTKKKTSVIKGMKPKTKEKKPFDASLVLKDDGSIEFAKKKKNIC